MPEKNFILSKDAAQEKLHRMALEVAETVSEDDMPLVLIGIRNSGLEIAQQLNSFLVNYIHVPVQIISVMLDKHQPAEVKLSEQINFEGKNIILVDDVSNSGRTLLYALKPLLDVHPHRIQTLVLVERMHKLFPVKPDYVGLSVATASQDYIRVEIVEGKIEGAYVE